ncbi:IS66 family insertion sequence element accessory protein TnpB, partial [Pelomonas sp. Root1444]|uniref:IS66 family insertion sequence element accessory protein TnpB n=1 Tax=Pelomonas sp. Root1444 TaxID=1736464 RepID=UPI00138EFC05
VDTSIQVRLPGIKVTWADAYRAAALVRIVRVVQIFGGAKPHHAYHFADRRATRMKVLVPDGIGVWLAARRLHQGRFVWPREVPWAHAADAAAVVGPGAWIAMAAR